MNKFIIYVTIALFFSQCFSTELTEFGPPQNAWGQEYYESLSMPDKTYYSWSSSYKSYYYPFFYDNAYNKSAITQVLNDKDDLLHYKAKNAGYLGTYSGDTYIIKKHGFITNVNDLNNHYRILVLEKNDLVINPITPNPTSRTGIIWTDYKHIYADDNGEAKWGSTDNNARYKQSGLSEYGNYNRLVFFAGSAHSNDNQGGYGGGAISIHHNASSARNITLQSETLFASNLSSRKYGGGAIQGREDLGGRVIIEGKSWFLDNQVIEITTTGDDSKDDKGSGGGAIRGRCRFTEASQVYFEGNTSISSATNSDSFKIDDTISHQIGGGGGAICCAPNCGGSGNKLPSDLTLIEILGDATFKGNEATRFGGAIYVADGDIKLNPAEGKLVTFYDNYAGSHSYKNAIDLSATSSDYSPKLEIKPAGVVVFKDPITSVSTAITTICPTQTGRLDIYCDLFDPMMHNSERKYFGTSYWTEGRVNLHNEGWLRLTDNGYSSNQIIIPFSGTLGVFREITEGSFTLSNLANSMLEINTEGSINASISGAGTIKFLNNESSFNFANYSIDDERNIIAENSTVKFSTTNSNITITGSFQTLEATINSTTNGKFEVQQNTTIENSDITITSNSIHFEKNFVAFYESEDNEAEKHKVLKFETNNLITDGDFAINGLTLVLG